jgi:hypothetical protein
MMDSTPPTQRNTPAPPPQVRRFCRDGQVIDAKIIKWAPEGVDAEDVRNYSRSLPRLPPGHTTLALFTAPLPASTFLHMSARLTPRSASVRHANVTHHVGAGALAHSQSPRSQLRSSSSSLVL